MAKWFDKIATDKGVRTWLLLGVVLVFFQVVIGGITRLTDSGLSMTDWKVILGVLPPLNEQDWLIKFEEYKVRAAQQHIALHADMTLGGFKWIYFWEWFHRLWARSIGLVFFFPFVFFKLKGLISKKLLSRLAIVIGLASLAALFGWLMVKSGFDRDNRTWVSAYMLSVHLLIATSLISYLFWTYLQERKDVIRFADYPNLLRWSKWIIAILFIQIVFGGWMAGMRAGFMHMHFPFFDEADLFFHNLFDFQHFNVENFIDYEKHTFVKTWVHFLHRITAYLLSFMILYFILKINKIKNKHFEIKGSLLMLGLLIVQFILGIFTVLNYAAKDTLIILGTLHQAGAFLLMLSVLYIRYQFTKNK